MSSKIKAALGLEIRDALREMRIQLSTLNHRVGSRLGLKDADLDCLDLINRDGPIGPGALAKRAGLHPATVTGILDRLERGGWVVRDRDPADRRAVVVRPVQERAADVLHLYSGMNRGIARICADYDEAELRVLADFLRRAAEAGRAATDEL